MAIWLLVIQLDQEKSNLHFLGGAKICSSTNVGPFNEAQSNRNFFSKLLLPRKAFVEIEAVIDLHKAIQALPQNCFPVQKSGLISFLLLHDIRQLFQPFSCYLLPSNIFFQNMKLLK